MQGNHSTYGRSFQTPSFRGNANGGRQYGTYSGGGGGVSRRSGNQRGTVTGPGSVFGKFRSFVENVADAFDAPQPTRKDRLLDHWTRIQEYYTPQNQDDLRKLDVTDTTIPHHMESALRLLAQEMLETAASDEAMPGADSGASPERDQLVQPLEFGPCVEYLLQYHVLNDLVDFADADMPRGIRKYVLRFFGIFIEGIPLGLLPESAIRLPLVAIMRQCHHVIQSSPTTLINPMRRQEPMAGTSTAGTASSAQARTAAGATTASDTQVGANKRKGGAGSMAYRLGQGYHSIQNDKTAVILCHDLLKLVVTLFTRLREHSNMVYLFFDWGSEWQTARSSDLAVASLRTATSEYMEQSARGHEMFIMHIIVEYLLAPGLTGQLAREALVLVVQVLLAPKDKDRYLDFLLDHARIVELLVEHIGYLHSQMPVYRPMPRTPNSQLFRTEYNGGRRMQPLMRRMNPQASQSRERFDFKPHLQSLLDHEGLLKSVANRDQRESEILVSARRILEHVDAFFICWELLDEIAMVGRSDARLVAAVQSQLSNGFLRTHIEPALLANMASMNQANTTVSYVTDLINVTHSSDVLDALFMVILGPDLSPERPPQTRPRSPSILSKEDQELLDSIEDESLRAEAAALLLPPGFDLSAISGAKGGGSSEKPAGSESNPLRATLISWMTLVDNTHLSLNTLRMFDSILSTMNQFAYTSLALRNFLDEAVAAATTSSGRRGSIGSDDEQPLAAFAGHMPHESSSGLGSFYSGPAIGLGMSVAMDQELVRAVVERYLDASPSNISNSMPEIVVAAAMRIDAPARPGNNGSSPDGKPDDPNSDSHVAMFSDQQLEAPRNFQNMRSLIMREAEGCDEYVQDCLKRLRFNQEYISKCWQNKERFIRNQSSGLISNSTSSRSRSTSTAQPEGHGASGQENVLDDSSGPEGINRQIDNSLATFYPGGFLASLVKQFSLVVKRHMAYNLMLTSMVNKLVCVADPALCAYLFLANSATVPKLTISTTGPDGSDSGHGSQKSSLYMYDAFVSASAEAYVKSERVPRFSARLARQHREGVETAVRVGAAQPVLNPHPDAKPPASQQQQLTPPASTIRPTVVNALPDTKITSGRSYAVAAAATAAQGAPNGQPPRSESAEDEQDNMPLALLAQTPSKNNASADDSSAMDVDTPASKPAAAKQKDTANLRQVAAFLGTPIKRFVHGFIVLDEFGKEMAATALALHTLELDRAMDRVMRANALGSAFASDPSQEEYADLLEYYDPEEPAYKRAAAVKESLRMGYSVIDLSSGASKGAAHSTSTAPAGGAGGEGATALQPTSPTRVVKSNGSGVKKHHRRGSASTRKNGHRKSSASTAGVNTVAAAIAAMAQPTEPEKGSASGNVPTAASQSPKSPHSSVSRKQSSSSRRRSRRKSSKGAQQIQD
ncbi:hypothetical protein GQ54DRAFT_299331 [Martensiomyces pterosporus]|nr:hypothetical protein GQ54DRAFT_299331 [Martensiomyces pterosporus]